MLFEALCQCCALFRMGVSNIWWRVKIRWLCGSLASIPDKLLVLQEKCENELNRLKRKTVTALSHLREKLEVFHLGPGGIK